MMNEKSKYGEPWSQEFNIRGAAWGFAFTCRMCWENPDISEETREVYKWAEKAFVHLAKDTITDDEAVNGYGG